MPTLATYRIPADDRLARYERALGLLPADRRARIHGFRQPADALRSLLGELLVRSLIGERLGPDVARAPFARGPHGKPRVAGHADVHFNLSHSGDWAVCAVDSQPIGVDVERIVPLTPADLGAALSPAERAYLDGLAAAARPVALFRLWTLKESHTKALGLGLALEPRELTIACWETPPRIMPPPAETWVLDTPPLDADHALAVCRRAPVTPLEIVSVPTLPTVASGLLRD